MGMWVRISVRRSSLLPMISDDGGGGGGGEFVGVDIGGDFVRL